MKAPFQYLLFLLASACYLPAQIGVGTDGVLPPQGTWELSGSGGGGTARQPNEFTLGENGLEATWTEGEPYWIGPAWGGSVRAMRGVSGYRAARLTVEGLGQDGELQAFIGSAEMFWGGARERLVPFSRLQVGYIRDDSAWFGPGAGIVFGVPLGQALRPYTAGSLSALTTIDGGLFLVPSAALGLGWRPAPWFFGIEGNFQAGFGVTDQPADLLGFAPSAMATVGWTSGR